jgi:HK97 family phage portal protein
VGLIRSAARAFARASAGPTSGLATPERWVEDWFSGGTSNSAGVRVDHDTALTYSPFFAGVRVISEDVGSLPFPLYERVGERGKKRADGHPLFNVLRNEANPMMSSQQLRETLQGHALMWGNGVAQVVTHPRTGVVEELWPLRPDRLRICVKWLPGGRFTKVFQYRDDVNGIYATLLPDEVLHIAGLGYDGVRGYPIVEYAAHSIGLGLATEMHGAKVFSNGSAPGGALTHPGVLSPEARGRMAADWENIHRSINNAHRVAILEEGVTWQAVGMPNDSAQFLETRKLQVTEAARWLRLPPHKIGDLDRATFSNIESQQIDYVASALRTWLVRWEQAVHTQLLTTEEKGRYYAEHLLDALLRGDTLSRYQAYAIGRQWGWLSTNDVRAPENLNPVEGGDTYLVPMNMVPADAPVPAAEPARTAARAVRSAAKRRRIAAAYAPKIAAADEELLALEAEKLSALAAKHLPKPDDEEPARARSLATFMSAVTTLYEGLIQDETVARWLPIFGLLAADIATDAAEDVAHDGDIDLSTWVHAYTLSHAAYRAATSIGQLRNAAEGAVDDPAAAVLARLQKWSEDRPEQTATWQTSQLPNAAAREAWRDAGVKRLKWVTTGSSDCPFCKRMDGKTVAIDKPFVHEGGEVTGLEASLKIDRDTHHPPLHPGCDCQVVPE